MKMKDSAPVFSVASPLHCIRDTIFQPHWVEYSISAILYNLAGAGIQSCLAMKLIVELLISLHLLSVAGSSSCSDLTCSQLFPAVAAICTIPSPSGRGVDYPPCRLGVATDITNPPCSVRVGQSVVLECADGTAVLFREGEPVGSGSIPFVQPEDEGVYECRSANDTLTQRNLTVNGEFWL